MNDVPKTSAPACSDGGVDRGGSHLYEHLVVRHGRLVDIDEPEDAGGAP